MTKEEVAETVKSYIGILEYIAFIQKGIIENKVLSYDIVIDLTLAKLTRLYSKVSKIAESIE